MQPQQSQESAELPEIEALLAATIGLEHNLEKELHAIRAAALSNTPGVTERLASIVNHKTKEWRVRYVCFQALQLANPELALEAASHRLIDKSEDATLRLSILWATGVVASPELIAALAQVATDGEDDIEIRAAAAQVLGNASDTRAVEPLLLLARDPEDKVRRAALSALWWFKDMRALPTLLDLARAHRDGKTRRLAVEALGQLGSPEAVPLVLDLLKSPEVTRRLRGAAALALGSIQDPKAFDPLLHAVEDENANLREEVVEALGYLGDRRANIRLISLLQDSQQPEDVRCAAARALGRLGGNEAVDALVTVAVDRNSPTDLRLRSSAIGELGYLADSASVVPLCGLLHDASSDVRWYAVDALQRIPDARAVGPIVEALHDTDTEVRDAAAAALGVIGDPRADRPLMITLETDEDPAVRGRAVEAIGRIGGEWVFDFLGSLLLDETKDERIRIGAIRGLGYLGAPRGLDVLTQQLASDDEWWVYNVVRALDNLGDARALPALLPLREPRDNSYVQEAIMEAIEKLEQSDSAQ